MTDAQGGREKYAWIFARPTITDRQLDNRFVGNCNGEVYALALHPRQHGPYKRLWFVDVAEDWANDVDFFRLMQRGVSIMK